MVEYLCRECVHATTRYSDTDTGVPTTKCLIASEVTGTFGNVKKPSDCVSVDTDLYPTSGFRKIKVSIVSDRYPRRKKGTAVDTWVDQVDPKIDEGDLYAE